MKTRLCPHPAKRGEGLLLIALVLVAAPVFARTSITRSSTSERLNIAIANETLSSAVKALRPHLAQRVQIAITEDPVIDFTAKNITAADALKGLASAAGATLTLDKGQYWIRKDREGRVTLDVKDQDIRTILASMKTQCGIRNLVIDRDVEGKGTFLFDKVPCRAAFDVVFRTMGLASVDYGNSVVTVGQRRR